MTFRNLILAFDIERSGGRSEHNTIALGAVIIDETYRKLDTFLFKGYVKGSVNFEDKCWDEFWSKHTNILEGLSAEEKYNDMSECEARMIESFQKFRSGWETTAKQFNATLTLVSDNVIFDGGYVNEMINKYTADLPIPYSAARLSKGNQKYAGIVDVGDIERGMLMVLDPNNKLPGRKPARLESLYNFSKTPIDSTIHHDHTPDNDAYTIACRFRKCQDIQQGLVKMYWRPWLWSFIV